MIVEAFESVDLPAPDATEAEGGGPSELERKVGYWTNRLVERVPFEDLRAAFDLACDNHADPRRPVNPVDVKLAYGELLAKREREKRAAIEREAFADSDRACSYCGPEKMATVYFPATGAEIVAPCRECRPAAFSTFMAQYHERHAPEVGVAQVIKAGRKLLGEQLKCDNPVCGREVNTYMTTHKVGGPCRNLLNRYTSDEGEPEICRGALRKV